MVVRDEADILALNLRYHSSMGVDRFYVVDHLSSEGTTELLSILSRDYRLTVVRKDTTLFHQSLWMGELAGMAMDDGVDWVINSDADEFWRFPGCHGAKGYLSGWHHKKADCLVCPWVNFVPPPSGAPFYVSEHHLVESDTFHKTIMRARHGTVISRGNHWVTNARWPIVAKDVQVAHYSNRSAAKSLAKCTTWADAREEACLIEWIEGGSMWERWRDSIASGGTSAEALAHSLSEDAESLRKRGVRLAHDPTMRKMLTALAQQE